MNIKNIFRLTANYKYALFCLALTVLIMFPFNLLAKQISMVVGESQVLNLKYEVSKVATGNPSICDVIRTNENEILVNATGIGQTNLLIWGKNKLEEEYEIFVKMRDASGLAGELRQLFDRIEGVEVRVVGNTVAVEGEVFSKKDLDRVSTVLNEVNGVINLVKMSPLLREVLSKEIQKAIGLKGVRVRNAKDSFILEGKVNTEGDILRAEKIASAYASDVVNVLTVISKPGVQNPGADKMIQLTLNIMELEKEALQDLGFHWNPGASVGASGSLQSGSGTGSIFGTISNFLPKMRRVKENGKGRTLFQQTVVTKNSRLAHFFVGDEIPIPVAQQGGTMSVEYKKVGLTLKFTPNIDVAGNIDISVDVDSSIVTGEGLGGAPRISTTNLQSAAYLKDAESMALGGLIGQREARTLASSPPGGGEAFVQLNDSKRFQNDETQVLVFITPKILNRASDAVKDMGSDIKDSFKKYELDNIVKPTEK